MHPYAYSQDRERTIDHVLDILGREGVPMNKVVMNHMDTVGLYPVVDLGFSRSVMKRGAYLGYDGFGMELYYDSMKAHDPSDAQRVDAILRLAEEGFASQILLSHDVWLKILLKQYGGYGYDHILKNMLPIMQRRGIKEVTIALMLLENPARVLAT